MICSRAFKPALITLALTLATPSIAKDAPAAGGAKKATKAISPDAPSADANKAQDYQVVTSNKFDFEAANIDGRMKAPMGFMLQGRKAASQVNMVELRSNFKNELMDSKSAVMAIPAPIP